MTNKVSNGEHFLIWTPGYKLSSRFKTNSSQFCSWLESKSKSISLFCILNEEKEQFLQIILCELFKEKAT